MRIGIISPYFPPDHGGVADHSQLLIAELLMAQHQVILITGAGTRVPTIHESERLQVFSIPRPWKTKEMQTITQLLAEQQLDRAIIQYTPLSFAPNTWGIFPTLPWWMRCWSRHCPLLFFAHESNYPIEPSLKGMVLGISHYVQFWALAFFVPWIAVTHQRQINYWGFWPHLRKKLFKIPTYSNIEVTGVGGQLFDLSAYDIRPDDILLCYFGGTHSSIQLDFLQLALARAQELFTGHRRVWLLMAGTERADWQKRGQILQSPQVLFVGKLASEKISSILQQSHLILLPFADGVNTRRGTLMAALAHGRPVVTTQGINTFDDVPWEKILFWAPADQAVAYAQVVHDLLLDPEHCLQQGKQGRQYFDQHFAKKVIVRQILSLVVPG